MTVSAILTHLLLIGGALALIFAGPTMLALYEAACESRRRRREVREQENAWKYFAARLHRRTTVRYPSRLRDPATPSVPVTDADRIERRRPRDTK